MIPDDRTVENLKAMRYTLERLAELASVALATHLDKEIDALERRMACLLDDDDERAACEARRARLWLERVRCDKDEGR